MECGACWDGWKQTAPLLQHPKVRVCVGVMWPPLCIKLWCLLFQWTQNIIIYNVHVSKFVHIIMGFNGILNISLFLDCYNVPCSYLIWWASQTHPYKKRLKFERSNNCLKEKLEPPCELQQELSWWHASASSRRLPYPFGFPLSFKTFSQLYLFCSSAYSM